MKISKKFNKIKISLLIQTMDMPTIDPVTKIIKVMEMKILMINIIKMLITKI